MIRPHSVEAHVIHRDTGLHASAEEVLAWLATWGGNLRRMLRCATSKFRPGRLARLGAPARVPTAKNAATARSAVAAISEAARALGQNPGIGRTVEEMPEYRELLIDFSDSGYVALHRPAGD